jgi:long-chain fatty acid transport protein
MRARLAALGAALLALTPARPASAGGFEMPGNGSEALGRGAAFVAKADDPTAIEYNPAGLAVQRGTKLMLDGHLIMSSYGFQRYGAYPGTRSAQQPWAGLSYPRVSDQSGPFFAPFIAATSDFGTFDWMTFSIGVFGPSGVGNRTYPLGVQGAPAASRYDVVQSNSLIALPTAAVGVKVTDWLELGAALHFVYGQFSLTSTSFVDLGDGPAGPCLNYEYQPCDSVSRLDLTGTSWGGTFGAMVHPSKTVSVGLSARTPISISATGTATVLQSPLNQPIPPQGHATFETDLPWILRAGVRQAFRDPDGFETADIELDGDYETWSMAQGGGPAIHIDHLGPSGPTFDDINVQVAHHYNDTFSVRAGGAYNTRLSIGTLALRLGAYYDKSATSDNPGYTRLDFDTLDKIAGTVGVGLKWGAFQFNLSYAEVFEPDRTVPMGTGETRPIDGAAHGAPVDSNGHPLPAVNEGIYQGHTEILSFGVVATFDDLFGWHRAAAKAKPDKPRDTPPPVEPAPAAEPEPEAKAEPVKTHKKASSAGAVPAKTKKSDWDD